MLFTPRQGEAGRFKSGKCGRVFLFQEEKGKSRLCIWHRGSSLLCCREFENQENVCPIAFCRRNPPLLQRKVFPPCPRRSASQSHRKTSRRSCPMFPDERLRPCSRANRLRARKKRDASIRVLPRPVNGYWTRRRNCRPSLIRHSLCRQGIHAFCLCFKSMAPPSNRGGDDRGGHYTRGH